MATCKDCIHYDICIFHLKGNENEECVQFRNKADVVEAVRCKDCKWNKHGGSRHPLCVRGGMHLKSPDDHCSYGERKETKDEAQANRIYT